MTKIELLAPAKNYEYGVAAILSGADAVYIGAPKFGARYSAVNTIEEIAELTQFAHKYGVKVFVTMNTLLFDDELESARLMTQQLSDIGVDALIVQDMAYLTFGVDVPFHASTQAAALTPEKARFYQDCGFERVILERAMSIDDFKHIRENTTTELEAFVHGAICVSYSGQCYMGHVLSDRSGNRGVCSQPCRSTWDLVNEKGDILVKDKHVLSLLDMSLADHIEDMIDAGITSFKIEGRLKDISYLKNSVAFYRQQLDKIINSRDDIEKASYGNTVISFDPQPLKTFSRGFTDYFITGEVTNSTLASFHTAKAVGEVVGKVHSVGKDYFTILTTKELGNGDGICFVDKKGVFGGTNINIARRERDVFYIYPNKMDTIAVGMTIWRNNDKKYTDEVTRSKMQRVINVSIYAEFTDNLTVKAIDETGTEVFLSYNEPLEKPKDTQKMQKTLVEQLSKSGDTIFNVELVEVVGDIAFMPVSIINSIRRELLTRLSDERLNQYKRNISGPITYAKPYIDKLNYKANVVNKAARDFYLKCGFTEVEWGVEIQDKNDLKGIEVMRTRYCIRRQIGQCLKQKGNKEKLFIVNNNKRFELKFDCANCEMIVVSI